MRRVLLVAYHYPPEGSSSGVLRTLKFSRYLGRHGWRAHVLTLRESAYAVRDDGLLRQIPPDTPVHRTRGFDAARRLSIRGRYPALVAIPDRHVSWLPFAVARGLGVIRREGIQALYSTSPVPTAHLIARTLHGLTRLPWIADFRDPWIEEGIYPKPGTLRYRFERALEGSVVRKATRITVTTPELGAEIRSRYPGLPEGKVRVIYNGYDEEDFSALPPPARSERFEIVHAGMVTPEFRDPFPLLVELRRLLEEGAIPRKEALVTFLGGGGWVRSTDFERRVAALGLADVVRVEGRVPHDEALRRQAGAAALLVLQASDDTRHLIPAKAFEYLRLGRPVVALTLPGATAGLLQQFPRCHVLEPADGPGLHRALLDLYAFWRESPDGAAPARSLPAFERSRLAGELARLLDELVPGAAPAAVEAVTHA